MQRSCEKLRDKPISVWKEKDTINNREIDVLVVILDSPGCEWASRLGCTMCGYNNGIDHGKVTTEEFVSQIDEALKKYSMESYVKIFTSGSFLDTKEIPYEAQKTILERIKEKSEDVRLLVESRPEYVNKKRLQQLSRSISSLEIAIGLETSSDRVRYRNIRKGFSWEQYLSAGSIVKDLGLHLKTYLLLKPPLLGEAESMDDAITSVIDVSREFPGSRISINPMNIQKGTVVENLFNRGLYSPPWIWTLINVLRIGHDRTDGRVHLMSSPTAGGRRRGVHNCGKCDNGLLDLITRFSIDNVPERLDGIDHECRYDWKKYLDNSRISPVGVESRDPRNKY